MASAAAQERMAADDLLDRADRASMCHMETTMLTDLIELYMLRCEVEGKSPATIRAYRETLRRFERILREDGGPPEVRGIRREHLYAYLGRFTALSSDTRHRYFREVRCFFNWLVEGDYLAETPFRGMHNVRLPQRVVQPYSPDEIARLLASCVAETPAGIRDRALVLLLLDTGARCSEVVGLDLGDVDFDTRRVRIRHGKGNKQRVAPFAERCVQALSEYLTLRGTESGPLFEAARGDGVIRPGVRLKPNGLKQMLRRLGRRSGVAKVHAHRFRHTFATWAIQHDARELDVQYLLGHSSPDMVRRYSSSYRSEQAALRHQGFSPADQMLTG